MVMVVRGDVILCDLNPVVGTEQAGVRPALVVHIDRVNRGITKRCGKREQAVSPRG
jgi:mRNA-degrading endonuclease toxin of MazEF toxin-antitoxin module